VYEQVESLQTALEVDRNELANLREDNARLLSTEDGHNQAGNEVPMCLCVRERACVCMYECVCVCTLAEHSRWAQPG
jgi:hypothetical protein